MREAIRSRLIAALVDRGLSEAAAWAHAEARLDDALQHVEQTTKALEDDERDEAGLAADHPAHARVRSLLADRYALRALDEWIARKL